MRLPEHIATADATLIEPLSCAVRGYGVLDPATFITDRLPLQDYALAIDRFASGAGLKTQVLP